MKLNIFILLSLALLVGISPTPTIFDEMLKHRNDCPSKGFYSYDAFITAARSFNGFGTTGDTDTRKKELAAFLAQTSHETTGAWANAPDGPYAVEWPCAAGRWYYYGRGPIQLTYSHTPTITSFKTAVWFWMTPQANKPSSHNVIIGQWMPSDADRAANRFPGYGVITNIINGGLECGTGVKNAHVRSRIGFYKRYCDILGISVGNNLACYNQKPFA